MSEQNLERPELTFSPEVADGEREHYAAARVILEYGSGGSTVLASEMPGKMIFSVENNRRWLPAMQAFLDQAGTESPVHLHLAGVGKTRKWVHPIDRWRFRRYHLYPLEIWDRLDFVHPDLVLIDGRFREACFYAAMLRCMKNTVVLFDDYVNRPKYHRVEAFIEPVETRGRKAKFELRDKALPREGLTQIIGAFSNAF